MGRRHFGEGGIVFVWVVCAWVFLLVRGVIWFVVNDVKLL